ncbi:MAG: hypothetical protein E4H13_08310 [Calditrichales bacterium]|nr:MAG: hypothetical protein E4H13_08310 [Calditrichales bacterium]
MESSASSTQLEQTATKMTTDMRFCGAFSIVYGIFTSLSIIGAIIGIPYIFIGMHIRDAADRFTTFMRSKDENDLLQAFEKQARAFYILKVVMIAGLVIAALAIIISIGVVMEMMNQYN